MDPKQRNILIAVAVIAVFGIAAFALPRLSKKEKYPEGKSYMEVVGEQQRKEKAVEIWKSATPEEALARIEPKIQEAIASGGITEEQAEQKRNAIRQRFAKKAGGRKGGKK